LVDRCSFFFFPIRQRLSIPFHMLMPAFLPRTHPGALSNKPLRKVSPPVVFLLPPLPLFPPHFHAISLTPPRSLVPWFWLRCSKGSCQCRKALLILIFFNFERSFPRALSNPLFSQCRVSDNVCKTCVSCSFTRAPEPSSKMKLFSNFFPCLLNNLHSESAILSEEGLSSRASRFISPPRRR